MLVVANRLRVAEGHEDEFLALFEEQAERIRDRSGLENVEILSPVEADRYVIQAYWNSREAFDQWRDSEEFRDAHADLPAEMFIGPNQLEIYEVAMTTEPNHTRTDGSQ